MVECVDSRTPQQAARPCLLRYTLGPGRLVQQAPMKKNARVSASTGTKNTACEEKDEQLWRPAGAFADDYRNLDALARGEALGGQQQGPAGAVQAWSFGQQPWSLPARGLARLVVAGQGRPRPLMACQESACFYLQPPFETRNLPSSKAANCLPQPVSAGCLSLFFLPGTSNVCSRNGRFLAARQAASEMRVPRI